MARVHQPFRLRLIAAVIGAVFAARCGGSPSTPTPPPAVVPDPPVITCPAPVTVASLTGAPASVVYGSATTTAGAPPVQVTCSPASQSTFPVGTSTVTCTAVDARQRTASCTFTITVTTPPRLSVTKFLAFGDSLTAGEITDPVMLKQIVIASLSYPADLQTALSSRYTAQSVSVDRQGAPGEAAELAGSRLSGILSRGTYDVMLLMDGANDLTTRDSLSIPPTVDAMRLMVRDASSRGVRPFLATIPPQDPAGSRGYGALLVPDYNAALRQMASSEGVPLVDIYQAFGGNTTTLIGNDGLHPTALGYQRIADTFFAVIKQKFEVAPPASLGVQPVLPFFLPPRRR